MREGKIIEAEIFKFSDISLIFTEIRTLNGEV